MSSIVTLSEITVETKYDALVVDSRLVATGLGIEHESFMRTLKKYESILESRFGTIRFEIGTSTMPDGRINPKPEKFAWLTEDQSLFLMTLSRNTDQVVKCKADLVDAFAKARKIIPAQSDRIKELELQNSILEKQLAIRQIDNSMVIMFGAPVVLALQGKQDQLVDRETVVTEVLDLETGKAQKILTADQLKKAVKDRTGQKLKTMKQFTDALREAGRDDLLVPVNRPQVNEYVIPDRLDEAISIVYGRQRQRLLGE